MPTKHIPFLTSNKLNLLLTYQSKAKTIHLIAEDTLVLELQNTTTQAKAFEMLVNTYKERLYWHIRRIVLNHDDADDVLQNTFIKVYRSIHGFKGESKTIFLDVQNSHQ